jgi:hypothetical protein
MRITVNLDCTPEEARDFLGLPDMKPMQDALMTDMENAMRGGLRAISPENMMKAWMPSGGAPGLDQMQKLFFDNMQKFFSGLPGAPSFLLTSNGKKQDAA